jgi:hypothetical protein
MLNDLPVLLEHVPLDQSQHVWFMHDGAQPQFLCIVKQHLNDSFGEQSTGLHDLLTSVLLIFGSGNT